MRCTLAFPGAIALLALAHPALAQEPAGIPDPVGEYTIELSQGPSTIPGTLSITEDGGTLIARMALEGQSELVFGTVRVDDRTVTLSDRLQAADLGMVLRIGSEDTLEGTWSLGLDGGTLVGRRGVDPNPPPISCTVGTGHLPPTAPTPEPTPDPDHARMIASDVNRFWEVLDADPTAEVDELARAFHCAYLREGTDGLRDFIPGRILGARRLAETVMERRDRYEAARASSLSLAEVEPAIRTIFHELEAIHPEAVFPDLYFLVGRLNSGGTVSQRGLLIGAEMYTDHSEIPHIVAHEVIHYQQPPIPVDRRTLLAQAIMEGSADFVAELISGRHINESMHEYALPREGELWAEFADAMHGRDLGGWLYGNPPEGRPSDLGYFFGYRIAQAYYERAMEEASDPAASRDAVRKIMTMVDFPDFLERSGYDPRAR
jgi:hypothetical protein